MLMRMRSTKVNNFFKKEPNLSFVAAKIQQNCTGTGNYDSKATRQGIICENECKLMVETLSSWRTIVRR